MEIKQFGVADLGRLDKKWGGLDTAWLVFCQRLDSTVTIFQLPLRPTLRGEKRRLRAFKQNTNVKTNSPLSESDRGRFCLDV